MLKYFCLIVLIFQIHGAPVDDAVNSDDDKEVLNVVDHTPSVHENAQKSVTTKQPKVVEILESGSDHQIDGSYSFHYRGADGSFREETAVVKNPGTKQEHLEISGAYSFFDADGKEVIVHYKADDRGFVPVGSNIPDIISVVARENSQLPAIKSNNANDDEVEDSDVVAPNKTENN